MAAASCGVGSTGCLDGSVWLMTDEAETHPVVKEKFLHAPDFKRYPALARINGKTSKAVAVAWTACLGRPGESQAPANAIA